MTDSPLLEGVSPQECQAMRACLGVYEQYFRPGDIVYDLGGGRNMLGVLTNGAAVIERVDGKGERTILEHLEPGGVFGEMMMFRSAVDNSVVVRCAAPCCVSFLRSEAVLRRCEHACACHSRLVENLFRLVTDKATSLSERWRCAAAVPSVKSFCAILSCKRPKMPAAPFPCRFRSARWRIIFPPTAAP